MAPPELSKWEIWHAADALLAANNEQPTDEQVQAQLGSHLDVIAPAMREWRERRAGVDGAGLPNAMAALVLALYQEQTATAARLIDEYRTAATKELDVVQRRADHVADQLRAELRQEQDQTIRLQAKSVSQAIEISRANDELSKVRAKNADLGEQLDEARSQTQTTRAALAQEKMERRARNREMKVKQQTLAHQETTLRALQAEYDAARAALQSLRAEHTALIEERDTWQHRAETAEGQAAQAEAQANMAQQRAAQLHDRIDQLRAQEDQKTDERIQTLSKLLLAGGAGKRAD